MTNLGAMVHLGMSGGGGTESKKLIWTSLTLSRPLRQAQGRLYGTDLVYRVLTQILRLQRSQLIWTVAGSQCTTDYLAIPNPRKLRAECFPQEPR